jgi:hypothetical protein
MIDAREGDTYAARARVIRLLRRPDLRRPTAIQATFPASALVALGEMDEALDLLERAPRSAQTRHASSSSALLALGSPMTVWNPGTSTVGLGPLISHRRSIQVGVMGFHTHRTRISRRFRLHARHPPTKGESPPYADALEDLRQLQGPSHAELDALLPASLALVPKGEL